MRTSVVMAPGLSKHGSQALEHRLSSCSTRTSLLCSMWDLSASRIEQCLLHWQVDSVPLSHQGSPQLGCRKGLITHGFHHIYKTQTFPSCDNQFERHTTQSSKYTSLHTHTRRYTHRNTHPHVCTHMNANTGTDMHAYTQHMNSKYYF